MIGVVANNTQSTAFSNSQQTNFKENDDYIKLYGKDDVFNYELSPHQIETELLCGERLYFMIKFSTEKPDLSIKMVKNGQHTKLKHTSMQFQTGQNEKVIAAKTGNAMASDLGKGKKKE